MFAPPPVHLSRAEIQSRLSGEVDANPAPLHRHGSQSPTSPRKTQRLGKGDRIPVSPTIRGDRPSVAKATKYSVESWNILPPGFGEHPRQAPLPPKRPSAALDASWELPIPGAFPPSSPILDVPRAHGTSPPIPPKSPRRQWPAVLPQIDTQLHHSILPAEEMRIESLISGREEQDRSSRHTNSRLVAPYRTSAAPSTAARRHSVATGRRASSQSKAVRARGLVPGRIDRKQGMRPSNKQPSPVVEVFNSAVESFDWFNWNAIRNQDAPARRGTDGDIGTKRSQTQSDRPLLGKRQVFENGKSGFHDLELGQRKPALLIDSSQKVDVSGNLPRRSQFVDKELPATPINVTISPTEIYHGSQNESQMPAKNRKSSSKRRTPLAQVTPTDVKANSSVLTEENNPPGRLSSIPENSTICEKAPIASEPSTPVARHIHLLGGSVVTVSPPEATPWQRIIFIQGPVKLPKPTIVPRKNSVASLEPFQEVINQVYQDALSTPRRRSDDQVVDDVCDFFDEFGFESINFGGDMLMANVMAIDETAELVDNETKPPSTPPVESSLFGVGKAAAEYITAIMGKPSPLPQVAISPAETEETLRARGIASLAHRAAIHASGHRRGDSDTIAKVDFAIMS